MYSKKTRVHCYAFTLLPALIGLVLWSTNPQTVFPLAVLFTPVLLALTLARCLHLTEKLEKDYSITLREREFMEEYEALLQTMGKDAVIRRENKTKPRKKKAALDDAKDG